MIGVGRNARCERTKEVERQNDVMAIMFAWDPANFAGTCSKHTAATRKLMRHALLQEPFAGRSLLVHYCIVYLPPLRVYRSRRKNPVRSSVPGV